MPLNLTVLSEFNLVFVRSSGIIRDQDSQAAVETYATHPLAQPGQNLLNDMTEVRDTQITYPNRMALHNVLEPVMTTGGKPRTYVMYAPNARAQEMASRFLPFWDAVPLMTVVITESEAEALRLLDLKVDSIAELARIADSR